MGMQVNRPIATPIRPMARAAANAPATVAPKLLTKAQGKVQDAATGVGALWGTGAGAMGGMMLGVLFALGGAGTAPMVIAGGAIAAFGAVVGGFGGRTIGGWVEQALHGKPQIHAPSAANLVGGTIGGVLASAGGFWAGFGLTGLLGTTALCIPLAIATAVLGAIGGGAALEAVGHRLAGK